MTGSNSKFLSSDVLTELRGRSDEVHIFPLSFGEFKSKPHSTITITANTVKTYLGYLEEAFLLKPAHRYDVKGHKYIGTPYQKAP